MNDNQNPTPFELASVAALLALRERPGTTQHSIEIYLPLARSLLTAAAAELAKPAPPNEHDWMLTTLGFKSYTFAQVLAQAPPKKGDKKGRTMLGPITTRPGLEKAIRRVFPEERATAILKRGYLYGCEIKAITDDQAKRNKARTTAANEAKS